MYIGHMLQKPNQTIPNNIIPMTIKQYTYILRSFILNLTVFQSKNIKKKTTDHTPDTRADNDKGQTDRQIQN